MMKGITQSPICTEYVLKTKVKWEKYSQHFIEGVRSLCTCSMWAAACTGFVFAVESRAAGMGRPPQLIQNSIALHCWCKNHCQLINAMFSFPIPCPTFFLSFLFIAHRQSVFYLLPDATLLSRNIFLQWVNMYKQSSSSCEQYLIQISKSHHHFHCTSVIRGLCGLCDGVRLPLSSVLTI